MSNSNESIWFVFWGLVTTGARFAYLWVLEKFIALFSGGKK